MDREQLARELYEAYCKGVGGIAYNGDKLPSSAEFFADPNKQTQVNGWLEAADAAGVYIP